MSSHNLTENWFQKWYLRSAINPKPGVWIKTVSVTKLIARQADGRVVGQDQAFLERTQKSSPAESNQPVKDHANMASQCQHATEDKASRKTCAGSV